MESLDNTYLIRFQILQAYYNEYFFNTPNIFKGISPTDKINTEFITKSLFHLTENGYMTSIRDDDQELVYHIREKGIRFVERITGGEMEFGTKEIKDAKIRIVNLFQSYYGSQGQ